jgi:2-dehydro-3-deoxygluconokinase
MSEQRPRVAVVGEALIELAREADGRFRLGYAGDTFNVAVYLARGGIETAFVTALGEDQYSDAVVALATAEGIAGDLMLRIRGRLPGLAVLETDASGARHSCEWRGEAPVRDLFELPHWGRLAEGLAQAKLVYFSGITLSLYSNVGLGRFLATLEAIRAKGVKIVFDGNFRPRGWRGDLSRARTVFIEALKRVDIALPTYDDEAVLWGDPSPEATVARLQAFGMA